MFRRFSDWATKYPPTAWQAAGVLVALLGVAAAIIVPITTTCSTTGSRLSLNLPMPTAEEHAEEPTEGTAASKYWIQALGASPDSNRWQGDVEVAPGDRINFYVAVHNHADGDSTPCLTADVPQEIGPDQNAAAEFTVLSSPDNSNRIQDKLILHSDDGARLEYLPNTLRIQSDLDGDTVVDDQVYASDENASDLLGRSCLPIGHVFGFDKILAGVGFTFQALPAGD